MNYLMSIIRNYLSNPDKMNDVLDSLMQDAVWFIITYLIEGIIHCLKALWNLTAAYFKKILTFVPLLEPNRIQSQVTPAF